MLKSTIASVLLLAVASLGAGPASDRKELLARVEEVSEAGVLTSRALTPEALGVLERRGVPKVAERAQVGHDTIHGGRYYARLPLDPALRVAEAAATLEGRLGREARLVLERAGPGQPYRVVLLR